MAGIVNFFRQYLISVLLLSGVFFNSDAQGQDVIIGSLAGMSHVRVHLNLPEDATARLSIANTGGPPSEGLGNCGYVEAVFAVLGAISDSYESPVLLNGGSNVEELTLLHRETVHLMPGQTKPITVSPNFTTSSVIFATVTRPQHIHCLSQSAVSVSSPLGFGVVGDGNALRRGETILGDIVVVRELDRPGRLPACCACAPVCGCGFCD